MVATNSVTKLPSLGGSNKVNVLYIIARDFSFISALFGLIMPQKKG